MYLKHLQVDAQIEEIVKELDRGIKMSDRCVFLEEHYPLLINILSFFSSFRFDVSSEKQRNNKCKNS